MTQPTDADHEARQKEAGEAIYEFIQGYLDAHDHGAYMYELGTWMYTIIFRARQTYTTQEVLRWLYGLVMIAEGAIETAKEEGHTLLVAEDWRGVEGGAEMVQALKDLAGDEPMTVPDWMVDEAREEE